MYMIVRSVGAGGCGIVYCVHPCVRRGGDGEGVGSESSSLLSYTPLDTSVSRSWSTSVR
jgi:hypothetical protein